MRWPTSAYQPSVTLQKEVKFSRMGNVTVHDCSSWTISAFLVRVSLSHREKPDAGVGWVGITRRENRQKYEPNMVVLADHDNGNFGVNFEFLAGLWRAFFNIDGVV